MASVAIVTSPLLKPILLGRTTDWSSKSSLMDLLGLFSNAGSSWCIDIGVRVYVSHVRRWTNYAAASGSMGGDPFHRLFVIPIDIGCQRF